MTVRIEPGPLTAARQLAVLERARELVMSSGSQLDGLCALAARIIGAPTAVASVVDSARTRVVGRYGLGEPWSSTRQVPLPPTLRERVIAGNEPLVVADTRTEPGWRDNKTTRELDVVACIGYPLRNTAGAPIGALWLWASQPRTWTEDDLDTARECARQLQIAIAIQAIVRELAVAAGEPVPDLDDGFDGRLLRWDGLSAADLGRPADAAPASTEPAGPAGCSGPAGSAGCSGPAGGVPTGLVGTRLTAEQVKDCELATTRALAEAGSVREAVPAVLDAVATTLDWAHAELWLVDEVTSLLRPAAVWTAPGHALTGFVPDELVCGQGFAGTACKRGEPVAVVDLATDYAFFGPDTASRYGLRTALAVPIRSTGHGLGVLAVFGATPETADESLVSLLTGVAAHIGQFLERRRAEELALQLARTKDEFIALVGHEMRTPLTSIGAYTELLIADPQTPADQREQMLGIIHRNVLTLRRIIEDLLDLAGLESGHITMKPESTDLAALTRDAVAAVRDAAAGKDVTLVDDIAPVLEATVDPARLRQVLDNLLNNAVTYTPAGGRVAVTLAPDHDAAVLTVSDTGIGIPPAEMSQLFQRFFRASTARNEGIQGTGLGLTISRTIVERHHGTITVADNAPGTTFQVRLPLGRR